MCAAVAVNTLNTNAITLRDVEDSRDQSVAAAGTVAFLGLLTMLLEGVIVLLHFCTKGVLNPYVVGLPHIVQFQLYLAKCKYSCKV